MSYPAFEITVEEEGDCLGTLEAKRGGTKVDQYVSGTGVNRKYSTYCPGGSVHSITLSLTLLDRSRDCPCEGEGRREAGLRLDPRGARSRQARLVSLTASLDVNRFQVPHDVG